MRQREVPQAASPSRRRGLLQKPPASIDPTSANDLNSRHFAGLRSLTSWARNRHTAAVRPEIAASNFSSTTEGSNDDPCTCLSVGEGLMVI
jgi:hypothetical protein